jgi:hypothetical protein
MNNSFHQRRRSDITGVRDQSGQALILAVIIMAVLVVGATAAASLMSSNQTTSGREKQAARALAGGEAGLQFAANAAVAAEAAGTQSSVSGHPATTTVDGNQVTWTATKAGLTWTLDATAVSPNGKVTRVLQEQVQQLSTPGQQQTPPIYGYGFVMGGAPHTGSLTPDQVCSSPSALLPTTSFGGSGAITVPTWIEGDVCITGGANPAIGNPSGSTIPVHIGGAVYVNGPNYAIGTPTSPVASAAIISGCWAEFHGWKNPACDANAKDANNGGSGLYAGDFSPPNPSPLPSKPTFTAAEDITDWQTASPGPLDNCTGAGTTGTPPANLFDNNAGSTSGPDTSLGTQNLVTLLGTHAFDCFGAGGGELKWSPPAAHGGIGQLTLEGMVFFDASLTMGGADYIQLMPNSDGTIYMDGSLLLTNDASLCLDPTTCNYTIWDPSTDSSDPLIDFAAYNRSGAQYGIDMEGNSRFEGIAFTNGGFYLSNSSTMAGSVFADYGTVAGAGSFKITNTPPTGAPGTTSSASSAWIVAPHSWRECPVTGCS